MRRWYSIKFINVELTNRKKLTKHILMYKSSFLFGGHSESFKKNVYLASHRPWALKKSLGLFWLTSRPFCIYYINAGLRFTIFKGQIILNIFPHLRRNLLILKSLLQTRQGIKTYSLLQQDVVKHLYQRLSELIKS